MTSASDESPTRRIVLGYQGAKYVVELRSNLILVRPKGARSGGSAEVAITPSRLHDKLLAARVEEERPRRKVRGRQVGRIV